MGAKTKARKKAPPEIMGPTPERLGRGSAEIVDVVDKGPNGREIVIGKVRRFTPMIDTLRHLFTDREWKALHHYRHHAMVADKSPMKDSLDKSVRGGSGGGPTIEVLNACRVVADIEGAVGSLVDLLRAVVLEDVSLAQWAMNKAGAVEKSYTRKDRKGKLVPVSELRPKEDALKIANLELRVVAQRVEAELAA